MIKITENLSIDENEISESFIRGSGPGGQRVNKVATAVQLRFDVKNSPSLPAEVRRRLLYMAGKRLTSEGVLIIEARRFRSLEKNRQDALQRLVTLIRKAARPLRVRRQTKPTAASKEQRLAEKRRRSEIKKSRHKPPPLEE